MTAVEINEILEDPSKTSSNQALDLEQILERYPYFQSVKVVHLKALKDRQSITYNSALKKAAAYTQDRTILFDFITSKVFLQHQIAQKIKGAIFDAFTTEQKQQDLTSNTEIQQEAAAILDPDLFEQKHPKQEPEKTPEQTTLGLGKPLIFDKKEHYSFSQWLELGQKKPIIREKSNDISTEKKRTEKTKNNFAIIDSFLEKNPKITPAKDFIPSIAPPIESTADKQQLMTQTLAKVYVEQKKYKKAIQAYKILILKYPEKSSLFANQINAIKKLQQHNS